MTWPTDEDLRRARLYELLAVPFRYPLAETVEGLYESWGDAVFEELEAMGISPGGDARLGESFEDFEVAYIGLFEVGLGGAPCPLHSGYYARDRMLDLEEVVRFYDYFDFKPARTPDRFPDHLEFELAFMAKLVRDAESYAAQGDFVERHLANWIPQLRASVDKRAGVPFIRDAVRLLDYYVEAEQLLLNAGRRRRQNESV